MMITFLKSPNPKNSENIFCRRQRQDRVAATCRHPNRQALRALKTGADERWEPNEYFSSRQRWLVLVGQVARLKKKSAFVRVCLWQKKGYCSFSLFLKYTRIGVESIPNCSRN